MPIRRYELKSLPELRVNSAVTPALNQLKTAHLTISGVLDSLHVVRQANASGDARGRLREAEVDLIRAAVVFAGASLDAVVKRQARDALPALLAVGSANRLSLKEFKSHVSASIRDKQPSKTWTDAVLADDPRQAMVEVYVSNLTTGSLQSTTDLKRMRTALGIAVEELADHRIDELGPFLKARNQIAHDLDTKDPSDSTWGQRHGRTVSTTVSQCDAVLAIATIYVQQVSVALGGPPKRGRPRKRA